MRALPIANPYHLPRNILRLRKIDKRLTAQFHTEIALVVTAVDAHDAHAHCFGELHAHVADAASGAREDGPVAWLEAGFAKGGVDGAAAAHDGAGGEVVDAVWDAGGVAGGAKDISGFQFSAYSF